MLRDNSSHFCLSFSAEALTASIVDYLFKDVCTQKDRVTPSKANDKHTAHYKRFRFPKVMVPFCNKHIVQFGYHLTLCLAGTEVAIF